MAGYILVLVSLAAVASALPTDPVIRKLEPVRYQYVYDDAGKPHLEDLWVKASDLQAASRYSPDYTNQYHLYTRSNPKVSEPIVFGNRDTLEKSSFSPHRRTVVVIHGWGDGTNSQLFPVVVPAYLAAEDVNVITVNWSAGSDTNYVVALLNTVTSGRSVARFIDWLNSATGSSLSSYHFAGYSLGGHQVGIIGRNLDGKVGYITALDPAFPGWVTNSERFQTDDGIYTEVIHTNIGEYGFVSPLGQVDFYPNGGNGMPGCDSINCNHSRSFYYFAESLQSQGFTGRRCASYLNALTGNCHLPETLRMGGVTPKTGETGVYYLETNAAPPFSIG